MAKRSRVDSSKSRTTYTINTIIGMVVSVIVIAAVSGFVFTQILTILSNSTIVNNTIVGPFVKILAIFLSLAFGIGGGVLVLRWLTD